MLDPGAHERVIWAVGEVVHRPVVPTSGRKNRCLWLGSPAASLRMGQKALFPPGRPGQCDGQTGKRYL
jgi:hypothetical protein